MAVGQLHVGDDHQDIVGVLGQQLQAAGGVGGLQHRVAFQLQRLRQLLGQELAQAGFIVDDEEGSGGMVSMKKGE
ncbi:hypothetical protein GCM10022408_36290 [Hymenobacter fastidiosus]|uniref:Uncharacterized protein n=1 Tax=Hymenobacter fastidiosus TaxID=486264 RepID=A0ABP7T012_9BACT